MADEIKTLYVAPDGSAYRLEKAGVDPLTDKWVERYSVLTVDGYMTVRDELPEGARKVWGPAANEDVDDDLSAVYCKDCNHPWGYHTEDRGCTMPIIPGSNIPVSRRESPGLQCGCRGRLAQS